MQEIQTVKHAIDFGERQYMFKSMVDDLTPDIRCRLIYMVTKWQSLNNHQNKI